MTGPPLLQVPYLLAYTCMGAAVVHPSVNEFGSASPRVAQPWTVTRLALIVPALLAPCLVVTVRARDTTVQILLVVSFAGLVLTLLLRAVSAVRNLARAQESLRHQATHDGLTGLPNRSELMERIGRVLGESRPGDPPVWVLFLDLDGFKLVNDSWGGGNLTATRPGSATPPGPTPSGPTPSGPTPSGTGAAVATPASARRSSTPNLRSSEDT